MRYFVALGALLIASCAHHNSGGVLKEIQQASDPKPGVTLAQEFEGQQLVPVDIAGKQFHTQNRESSMEKFPCVRCHKAPLAQMKHDGKDGKTKAHWNVELKHADKAVMNCSTCHDPADMNRLKTVAGQAVPVNASYQVCGQCHFKQQADWAGGAHGKRVAGWAPPRVSKTCVQCHNPHQPAWDKRIPVHVALTGVAK